jgi:predicted esterase YcpF (UPF0227 family)
VATGLPAVLINPAVRPHALLEPHRGTHRRWCDGAPLVVDDDYLGALHRLYRPRLADDERYLVLLQKGDETLDYRAAEDYYAAGDLVLIEGGSHRFENLDRCLPLIDGWLAQFDRHLEEPPVAQHALRRDAAITPL